MVEVTHRLGKVTLEAKLQRVVIIGLGVLDALDRFGIEPVTVSKSVQSPDYLQKYKGEKYASSGSFFEPDFESIYTQKPDLIIVGSRAVHQSITMNW